MDSSLPPTPLFQGRNINEMKQRELKAVGKSLGVKTGNRKNSTIVMDIKNLLKEQSRASGPDDKPPSPERLDPPVEADLKEEVFAVGRKSFGTVASDDSGPDNPWTAAQDVSNEREEQGHETINYATKREVQALAASVQALHDKIERLEDDRLEYSARMQKSTCFLDEMEGAMEALTVASDPQKVTFMVKDSIPEANHARMAVAPAAEFAAELPADDPEKIAAKFSINEQKRVNKKKRTGKK